ncbi:MAG: glucose-1-phosphate adenylyltransferase [Oscillatoriales cyanobacterium SM2_1_8]|nr:glucose-1-phosphate adenylyltransferase [Oscillatoriales cyanobacterium SM2_1_8]
MKDVLSIVLGGGQGTRLYPLTKLRAKPAVPVAGKYRLIDIPISNCLNSEIEKIYVLTQFNSASLNRHLYQTYRTSSFSDGFVEILAAQQTPENTDWFQGTSDAVRQYLWLFESWKVRDYLILAGDHLYRMDYRQYIARHRETNADVTLSVLPSDRKKASSFGLLKIDDRGQVLSFSEKPKGAALDEMMVDTTVLGLDAESARQQPFIASMGIYVFKKEVLIELLNKRAADKDFGKEVIPSAIEGYNVQAYLFDDYWEDIGTIESFYHANLELTRYPIAPFNLFATDFPIYTRPRYLPPSRVLDCQIRNSIVSEGCILERSTIEHSVVGIRQRVDSGCQIEDALFMGCDYYQTDGDRQADLAAGRVPLGIGANTTIRRAIVDKNVRIGKNVQIINKDHAQDVSCEERGYCIRSGIVVVLKGAMIPDNTII